MPMLASQANVHPKTTDAWIGAPFSPSNDIGEQAVAHLPSDTELYTAIASRSHVAVLSIRENSVLQMLGPASSTVECVAFCERCFCLAVGADHEVRIYTPDSLHEPHSWLFETAIQHDSSVQVVTWATSGLGSGSDRILWVGGKCLSRWSAHQNCDWVRKWARGLARPVALMSASADTSLLATTGKNDHLVKVWQYTTIAVGAASVDFTYIRHPNAVTSMDWRPIDSASPPVNSSAVELGCCTRRNASTSDSVLLTLCAGGVARLWRVATENEPGPSRMFLFATLATDLGGVCLDDDVALPPALRQGEDRVLQSAHWLHPKMDSRFIYSHSIEEEGYSLTPHMGHTGLSPGIRPPVSPLLAPGMGVPTLRPSLREHHNYLVGQLRDGSVVIWLLLGLATYPRCAPKLLIWATLPRVLASVPGILSVGTYCCFSMSAKPHKDEDMRMHVQQRAEDQLPSTVTMLQHTLDLQHPLRLCTINVERSAAGERTHQHTLYGHNADSHVIDLQAHPSAGFVASLDTSGTLLVWQCPDLAPSTEPLESVQISSNEHSGDDNCVNEVNETQHPSSPSCMLTLPGVFEAFVWIPSSHLSISLIAFGKDQAVAFTRCATRRVWRVVCHLVLDAIISDPPVREAISSRWLCAHAFLANGAPRSDCCAVNGFALRTKSSSLLIWTLDSGHLLSRSTVSLERAGLRIHCVVPAHQLQTDVDALEGDYSFSSTVICGYADGSLCTWRVHVHNAHTVAVLQAVLVSAPPAPSSLELCGLAVSQANTHFRIACLIRQKDGAQTVTSIGTRARLLIFELDSFTTHASLEFSHELVYEQDSLYVQPDFCSRRATSPCAMVVLLGGKHIVAACTAMQVVLFAQAGKCGEKWVAWYPLHRLLLPGSLPCLAVAWTCMGTLLVAGGASFFAWPELLSTYLEGFSCTMIPWVPEQFRQMLLISPARCQTVLRHLECTDMNKPASLALKVLLHGHGLDRGTEGSVQAGSSSSPECLDDLFAPSAPSLDIFASLETSAQRKQDAPLLPEPKDLQRPNSLAGHILDRFGDLISRGVWLPGLSMQEHDEFGNILRAIKAVDETGPAVDECGTRFVLSALWALHHSADGAVSAAAVAWAMQSDCHSTLLDLCCAARKVQRHWLALRSLGVGFWLPQCDTLRSALEAAAKVQFAARKEAEDCALLYIALGKKNQLQALCRATRNEKLSKFLSNDFTQERWVSAARKNAYSLLSKQQYELAAAFFLLGNDISSAVKVCARQLGDLQLALVLCRLRGAGAADLLHEIVHDELLPQAKASGDAWLCCVGHMLILDPAAAIDALANVAHTDDACTDCSSAGLELSKGFDPCAVVFCQHVMASPKWRLARMRVPLGVRLRSSYVLARAGCTLLALEALHDPSSDADIQGVRARIGLSVRFVLELAADLVGDCQLPGVKSIQALTIAQAIVQVREDTALVCAHVGITTDDIRECAMHHMSDVFARLADPMYLVQHFVFYSSLSLWDQSSKLLGCLSDVVEASLAKVLPHELPALAISKLLWVAPRLISACEVLVASGVWERSHPFCAQVTQVADCIMYSVGCSICAFNAVLSLLCGDDGVLQALVPPHETAGPSAQDSLAQAQSTQSPAHMYLWARFHAYALNHLRGRWRSNTSVEPATAAGSIADGLRPSPLRLPAPYHAFACDQKLPCTWFPRIQCTLREALGRLRGDSFPLDAVSILSRNPSMHDALASLWQLICEPDSSGAARMDASVAQSSSDTAREAYFVWPRDDEHTLLIAQPDEMSAATSLDLASPIELFHQKGDVIRAVCVNALNASQIAVSNGHSVHQLDLSDSLWQEEFDGKVASSSIHRSCVSTFKAKCLCAHPKLPLYLAGGDAVVQCWQFGQTIQGEGVHDHLRAQYKLPAGGRVSSLRISPYCSEQFGSMDEDGFLCLWRFQSGADMPLPFSRLQCYTRKGTDLCFVDSSVVLATAGVPQGSHAASICIWDVLLPPSQALVHSCAAHPEGAQNVVYCPSDHSLLCGGEKGEVVIFDLRRFRVRQRWQAHNMSVQALAVAQGKLCFSASADGSIKLWDAEMPCSSVSEDKEQGELIGIPCGHWPNAHETYNMLGPLVGTRGLAGINTLEIAACASTLVSGGADGKVKLWSILGR